LKFTVKLPAQFRITRPREYLNAETGAMKRKALESSTIQTATGALMQTIQKAKEQT